MAHVSLYTLIADRVTSTYSYSYSRVRIRVLERSTHTLNGTRLHRRVPRSSSHALTTVALRSASVHVPLDSLEICTCILHLMPFASNTHTLCLVLQEESFLGYEYVTYNPVQYFHRPRFIRAGGT